MTPEPLERMRQMVRIRRFEERCAELYSQTKIRGFLHLYIGEEAVGVGVMGALTDDDQIVATYREHGHALARGVDAGALMAEMFGRSNGCARGRGGSMHIADVSRRFWGGFAIVGGGLPIAVGLALADKTLGRAGVTACFFGDGATEEGAYHEALNLASLWKLPVLFVCENNQYAMGTALSAHAADTELTHEPRAHGIVAERVDGMDVVAVEQAATRALEAIRRGDGPRFLEFMTYRFRAHSMYDADKYRDKTEIARWKARDPLALYAEYLLAEGLAARADLDAIDAAAMAEVDAAVAFAEQGGLEPIEDLTKDVYTHDVSARGAP